MSENNEWKPIETAPKDRRILLWSWAEMYVGHWAQHFETGAEAYIIAEWGDEGEQLLVKATHWKELPAPPKDQV